MSWTCSPARARRGRRPSRWPVAALSATRPARPPTTLGVLVRTEAGTDAAPVENGAGPRQRARLHALGNPVLFWADDGAHGLEPWVTDGTNAGTRMVRDIFRADSSWPMALTDLGGTLYFSANTATRGRDLWKSDGTTEGTVLVKDLAASPELLTPVQDSLFFFQAGPDLWKSDGTEPGTLPVFHPPDRQPALQHRGGHPGGEPLRGPTSTEGRALWKSDGTAEGTFLVKDLWPGSGSSYPGALVNSAAAPCSSPRMTACTATSCGRRDGTAEGTVLVQDLWPGSGSGLPRRGRERGRHPVLRRQ